MRETTKKIITEKMIDTGFHTEEITELAEFINTEVPGVEVAVNQISDVAEFHNLRILREPQGEEI